MCQQQERCSPSQAIKPGHTVQRCHGCQQTAHGPCSFTCPAACRCCDSLLHGLSAALNQSLYAYLFRLARPHTPQPASALFRTSLRLQVPQHLKSHMMLLPVLLPNTVPTTRPAVLQTLQRPMQGCQCCYASFPSSSVILHPQLWWQQRQDETDAAVTATQTRYDQLR